MPPSPRRSAADLEDPAAACAPQAEKLPLTARIGLMLGASVVLWAACIECVLMLLRR